MASQSIVAELAEGDKVQVGLTLKPNHLPLFFVCLFYSHNDPLPPGVHVHPHRPDGQEEQLVHPLHRDVPAAEGLHAGPRPRLGLPAPPGSRSKRTLKPCSVQLVRYCTSVDCGPCAM